MNIIKKIFSIIWNPFTNMFKVESPTGTSFFDKHHFLLGLIALVFVAALMTVCYMFIYK